MNIKNKQQYNPLLLEALEKTFNDCISQIEQRAKTLKSWSNNDFLDESESCLIERTANNILLAIQELKKQKEEQC